MHTFQNSSNKVLSRNNKGRNGQGQTTQMEQEEEEDESSSSSSIAIPPIVSGVEKQPEIVEEEENVEVSLVISKKSLFITTDTRIILLK